MPKDYAIVETPKRRQPEDRKSGWDSWEVSEALSVLRSERRVVERAKKIRANPALMKKIRELAARERDEMREEREFLNRVLKT